MSGSPHFTAIFALLAVACDPGDTGSINLFHATARPVASDASSPVSHADSAPPARRDSGAPIPPTGCASDADCRSGESSICDVATGVCIECRVETDCTSGGRPHCDTGSGICVECRTDADCTDPSKPGCLSA